ncbi:hypothetical protein LMG28138_04248 [Pararobbsia alpina]|uniref:Uncharacterized protein n=1 Tax=Pararobbsia alpina TaxID=621374 RepID=A0A6S7BEH0_9BURK|nr:hypothetical protein LMG28138_04248 [Pararobbsia alpina]
MHGATMFPKALPFPFTCNGLTPEKKGPVLSVLIQHHFQEFFLLNRYRKIYKNRPKSALPALPVPAIS